MDLGVLSEDSLSNFFLNVLCSVAQFSYAFLFSCVVSALFGQQKVTPAPV